MEGTSKAVSLEKDGIPVSVISPKLKAIQRNVLCTEGREDWEALGGEQSAGT